MLAKKHMREQRQARQEGALRTCAPAMEGPRNMQNYYIWHEEIATVIPRK